MIDAMLQANSLSKDFDRRKIFSALSFSVSSGSSLAITGRNGTGKSTLAKILCGVLTPTSGAAILSCNGTIVSAERLHRHVGLVSPYVQMYDEFSGIENLRIMLAIRGLKHQPDEQLRLLLRQFGIDDRRYDDVRTYSSGMKQRLKYAAALLHEPELLVLDEPTSNLDEQGIEAVHTVMVEQKKSGILIIATNDRDDLAYADQIVTMEGGAR
jgi:heme exporter protein A